MIRKLISNLSIDIYHQVNSYKDTFRVSRTKWVIGKFKANGLDSRSKRKLHIDKFKNVRCANNNEKEYINKIMQLTRCIFKIQYKKYSTEKMT
jgi:hypothetical protein